MAEMQDQISVPAAPEGARKAPKGRLKALLDIRPGDLMPVQAENGATLLVPYKGPRKTYFHEREGGLCLRLRDEYGTTWHYLNRRRHA